MIESKLRTSMPVIVVRRPTEVTHQKPDRLRRSAARFRRTFGALFLLFKTTLVKRSCSLLGLGLVHGQLIFEPKFGLFSAPPSLTLQGFPPADHHFLDFLCFARKSDPPGFPTGRVKKTDTSSIAKKTDHSSIVHPSLIDR